MDIHVDFSAISGLFNLDLSQNLRPKSGLKLPRPFHQNVCLIISLIRSSYLRMFAANEKVFKLFF